MIRILKNFINKEGTYVFASSLFTKVCSFLTSLILIRILSPDEFGVLSYVLSALAFFIPFSGGGMQHSFLRYAPMFDDKKNKLGLFQHSLYRGLLFSFFLAFVLFFLTTIYQQYLLQGSANCGPKRVNLRSASTFIF